MAKPIEPTPILTGEDAKKVLKELENDSHDSKKEAFLKECEDIYNNTKENK